MPKSKLSHEDRFFVSVDAHGCCWEWTATHDPYGYGKFCFDRRVVGAHRYAYELLVGPIPKGLQLDHLCRNRACVNPDHLEPVTAKENMHRSYAPAIRSHIENECRRGHAFSPENTRIHRGYRLCITCHNDRRREYRARRKALGLKYI